MALIPPAVIANTFRWLVAETYRFSCSSVSAAAFKVEKASDNFLRDSSDGPPAWAAACARSGRGDNVPAAPRTYPSPSSPSTDMVFQTGRMTCLLPLWRVVQDAE